MKESVEKQIVRSIRNHKRGKIFFPPTFAKFGSSMAVRQALNRLEDKGLLVRLAQGIYLYPKKHKVLGTLYPSIEQIAYAIAKRDKARIVPTGANALNKLGLSTQVPLNLVYLTDGTPRTITVGKRKIKFKIASPKLLSVKDQTNLLVIQAIRELGKDDISAATLEKIREILEKVDPELIQHDMKLAPVWVSEVVANAMKSE